MARRVPQPHRQFLGVPAAEAALARGGHLTPVVDIILLEHAGGAVVRLAADPDRALDFLAVPPHFLTALIAIAGYIALALASARLSLAFPAAAIERPISLREAWDLMAGNYWRLFACLVACYLPFGVVHYIIVDKIGGELPSILWIIFQIVGLAVSFAGL